MVAGQFHAAALRPLKTIKICFHKIQVIFLRLLIQFLVHIKRCIVICLHDADVLSRSPGNAFIHSVSVSPVLPPDEQNTAVLLLVFLQDIIRPVCGTVAYAYYLYVLQCLSGNAVQAFRQISLCIIYRYNY